MTKCSALCALLLLLTLAACGGDSQSFTALTYGDLSSYPKLASQPTATNSDLLPQAAQYSSVQGMTFTSPDDNAAIRDWYKQQLTAKGWQQVADTASIIGFVKDDRSKLIQIFLSKSGAGLATKVVAYYATGKK